MSDKDANMCPQPSFNIFLGNEDCLYLNVYTPRLKFYPTMVSELNLKLCLELLGMKKKEKVVYIKKLNTYLFAFNCIQSI